MNICKLTLKVSSVEEQIASVKEQIEVVQNLPYYENFNKQVEREFDLTELTLKLKDLLSVKLAVLDNLTTAINLEKVDVSYYQRELNLKNYVLEKVN